jgi:hypothetical protein
MSHPTVYGQFLVKGDDNLYYQVSNPSVSKEQLEVQQGFPIDVWRSSFGLSNQGLATDPIKTPENPLLDAIFIEDKAPRGAFSRGLRRSLKQNLGINLDVERTSWEKQEDGTWNVRLLEVDGDTTEFIEGITEEEIKAAKQQNPELSNEEALILVAKNK